MGIAIRGGVCNDAVDGGLSLSGAGSRAVS